MDLVLLLSSIWIASAYVRECSEDREAELTADDLLPTADFGRSVAIDGKLVAVGAGGADTGSVNSAGAVYLIKQRAA